MQKCMNIITHVHMSSRMSQMVITVSPYYNNYIYVVTYIHFHYCVRTQYLEIHCCLTLPVLPAAELGAWLSWLPSCRAQSGQAWAAHRDYDQGTAACHHLARTVPSVHCRGARNTWCRGLGLCWRRQRPASELRGGGGAGRGNETSGWEEETEKQREGVS